MHYHHSSHVKKTWIVFALTLFVSIMEVLFGTHTHSHALKNDGLHLITHVGIFGLAILAYYIHPTKKNYRIILDYTGLLIAIALLIIGFISIVESFLSFTHDHENVEVDAAIIVMCVTMALNFLNFYILRPELSCGDNNLRAIYLHIVYDLLSSIGALLSLIIAKFSSFHRMDAIAGMIISAIIIKWSITFIISVYKNLKR